MNVGIVVAIVGIVIVVALILLKVLHAVLGLRFDKNWEKMSSVYSVYSVVLKY